MLDPLEATGRLLLEHTYVIIKTVPVTATDLRKHIYAILDEILETGKPVEIERKGRRLRIVAVSESHPLDQLPEIPDLIKGNADDLDSIHWDSEWNP